MLWLRSIILVLLCSTAAAQTETGIYPAASYDSDMIGNVNLNRGSLVIAAPLLTLKQKPGISFGSLFLTYSPPTYVKGTNCVSTSVGNEECQIFWQPADPNQMVTPAQIVAQGMPSWQTEMTTDDNGLYNNSGFVVQSADGSNHPMVPVNGGYRSIDGTNYRLNSNGTTLTDSLGTTYTIQGISPFEILNYPNNPQTFYAGSTEYSEIVATNVHGDSISSAPDGASPLPNGSIVASKTFNDSVGRTISVGIPTSDYTGCTGSLTPVAAFLATVSYPGHATIQYKYCYVTIHVTPGLYGNGTPYTVYSADQDFLQSVVQSIDGTWTNVAAWTFEYDWNIPNYGNAGVLTKITNPLGGYVQYAYGSSPANTMYGGNDRGTYLIVTSRTLHFGGSNPDQTTNYTYHAVVGNPGWSFDSTTVSSDTEIIEHDFESTSGVENVTRYKDPAGNLMKTVTRTLLLSPNPYHKYHESGVFPVMGNAQSTDDVTTYADGTTCEVTRQYGGSFGYSVSFYQTYYSGTDTQSGSANSGEMTLESVYDCSKVSANLLRTTTTTWKDLEDPNYSSANLFNLPSTVVISDSTDELSRSQSSYDTGSGSPKGDLTSVTHSLYGTPATFVITSTSYDTHGMPTDHYDGKGYHTHVVYDATGLFPAEIDYPQTNAISHIEHFASDPITGTLVSATDQNGVTSTAEYDLIGRPKKQISAYQTPLESWTQFSYPSMTEITVSKDKDVKGDALLTTTTRVDGFERVIDQTNEAGMTITRGYNQASNLVSQSNPYPAGSAVPTGTTTTFNYDALGRMIYQYQPGGNEYLHWVYAGNVTDFYDESNHHWQRTTDALGRLTQVLEPDPNSNVPFLETDYTYSGLNDLTRVDQWGGAKGSSNDHIRSFVYDALSRLTSSTNPEAGSTSYVYDNNGNVIKKTDARGVATNYMYDASNRLTSKTYTNDSSGTLSSCYQYDTAANGIGRLGAEWTQAGSCSPSPSSPETRHTILAYDAMNRILQEQQCHRGKCSTPTTSTMHYDLAGNPTYYSNGIGSIELSQMYDAAGRLQTIGSSLYGPQLPNYPANLFSVRAYNPAGLIQNLNLGPIINVNRTYDNRLRITGQTVTHP